MKKQKQSQKLGKPQKQQKPNSSEKTSKKYSLRARENKTIYEHLHIDQADLHSQDSQDQGRKRKLRAKRGKRSNQEQDYEYNLDESGQQNDEDIYDEQEILDKLPQGLQDLNRLYTDVKGKIRSYKQQFLKEQQDIIQKKSYVGEDSVPINADVTTFNFDNLIKKHKEVTGGGYFDVIMMDPPWKLSTSQPSRGVAIQYDSLSDQYIEKIPVDKLQKSGVLIIWAINAKYAFTVHLMEKVWGYKIVDSITWVKKTVNGKIAKGHGFYLQHAKETCLVGVKGDIGKLKKGVAQDVIFSDRRGQSQKPTEIYDYIEKLVPNGHYLEVFGRRNNLRDKWVTIGNEI